jgi:hypothetical protein
MNAAPVSLSATGVLAVVAVAAVGVLFWKSGDIAKAAGGVLSDAANAVNPANHDNVFATGVNDVGGAVVTDPAGPGKNADGSWSLGGWIFDVTHPSAWSN